MLLCLRLLHGTVTTKRICDRKFLHIVLWYRHSLAKLCTKDPENLSISVKVPAKKLVEPFLCGHGTEGTISNKTPSGKPCQKTLDWMTDKAHGKCMAILTIKLSGEKNGDSGAQNLHLGREPK